MTFDLSSPVICLITRGESTPENFERTSREIVDIVRVAVDEGVSLVQIREKRLTARLLFELTQMATEITRAASATRLLVNDRADIALAAGADGVHLAANSLSASVIRNSFPSDFLIGVSVHNIDEARETLQSADFALLGPVFETPGKGKPLGLQTFGEVCSELHPFPVLALGGIDDTNYEFVLTAGASGFAAIRSLNDVDSLRAIVQKLRK